MPLSSEPHSDGLYYYICREPPPDWTDRNPSSWFVKNWHVYMIMKHNAGFMTDALYNLDRKPFHLLEPPVTHFWLAATTQWEYDMLDAVGIPVLSPADRKFYLS